VDLDGFFQKRIESCEFFEHFATWKFAVFFYELTTDGRLYYWSTVHWLADFLMTGATRSETGDNHHAKNHDDTLLALRL
jgi:hypothetical protein